MTEYKFGDVLYYSSLKDSKLKTKCIFLRDEMQKAVVMFENADFAARVLYRQLSRTKEVKRKYVYSFRLNRRYGWYDEDGTLQIGRLIGTEDSMEGVIALFRSCSIPSEIIRVYPSSTDFFEVEDD